MICLLYLPQVFGQAWVNGVDTDKTLQGLESDQDYTSSRI